MKTGIDVLSMTPEEFNRRRRLINNLAWTIAREGILVMAPERLGYGSNRNDDEEDLNYAEIEENLEIGDAETVPGGTDAEWAEEDERIASLGAKPPPNPPEIACPPRPGFYVSAITSNWPMEELLTSPRPHLMGNSASGSIRVEPPPIPGNAGHPRALQPDPAGPGRERSPDQPGLGRGYPGCHQGDCPPTAEHHRHHPVQPDEVGAACMGPPRHRLPGNRDEPLEPWSLW